MIARLLISPSIDDIKNQIKIILDQFLINPKQQYQNNPDILYFPIDSKLGIDQAKEIKKHFSRKPTIEAGKIVVLENATALTKEAQNALLKTLEEPPLNSVLIFGANSDSKFLPTFLSRCQITKGQGMVNSGQVKDYPDEIERLIRSNIQERFEFIEKLKDKEEFLNSLIKYYRNIFHKNPSKENSDFISELLNSQKYGSQNVNIRAILEYLMLVMPKVV